MSTPCFCIRLLERCLRAKATLLAFSRLEIRSHITKLEFLPAFKIAFNRAFTPANICSAFRGAGLVPLQPEAVLSKLDVQLRTPTPPAAALPEAPWVAQTPSNARELEAQ